MSADAVAPIASEARQDDAQAKIERLRLSGELPSPKGVALAVMDVCTRDDATVDAIAEVIRMDPALATRMLRLANASAHAGGRPAVAIRDAVMRIGLTAVRQVAMGFSLVDQYRDGPCKAFDYQGFWSHSLLMAVAMRALGSVARLGLGDELFSCGLTARVGCLALATIHPTEYAALLEQTDGPADPTQTSLERELLGVDHNVLTAAILHDCGIPMALVEPIVHHENPEASGFADGSRACQLARLLYHAKRIADMGLAPDGHRDAITAELMLLGGKLGLDAEELGSLVDAALDEWRAWSELLEVPSRALPNFATMAAARAHRSESPEGASYSGVRVLLAEDDPTTRLMMEAALERLVGHPVHAAGNGREALAMALQVMPQIVVTDWMMPEMDGLEFCRALRATDWGQSMYVIMLTGVEDDEEIVQAFEAGVDDYVTKPVNLRALGARMRAALHYVQLLQAWERDRAQLKRFAAELAISNRRLEHHAMTDMLTELPNRRAGMDALARAWNAAGRDARPLTVLEVDIDRFKSVNDTHGHAVGDTVLIEIGRLIRALVRTHDHVSRVGGEEFLIVCQNADLPGTLQAAERLRRAVSEVRIDAGKVTLQVSISIGAATREPGMADADALLAAADRALYAAKKGGRDRTFVSRGGRIEAYSQQRPDAVRNASQPAPAPSTSGALG